MGECVNKLWYIHMVEHYLDIKINGLSSYAKAWRNLKGIVLSERSWSEKVTYYLIPIVQYSGKGNTIDSKKISGCHGLGKEEMNR